jgi:poly(3-hydroxybutyrate) depolymerase
MIVRLVHVFAVLIAASAAVLAGGNILNASERQSVTTTYSMKVDGLTRSWEEIVPVAPLPKSAPIIVMLSGVSEPVQGEIDRDYLVPYANADEAEVVYPVAYHESWNAIGCCGIASTKNVNDVGFLTQLAARIDPGHVRPIDLVGYSNGGRLAYRMACNAPGVFDEIAVVKADPEESCVVKKPQDILHVAALDDTAVPYEPGDVGTETPPATVENTRLLATDKCAVTANVTQKTPRMQYSEWTGCANGSRIAFAVYSVGGHNFPPQTKTQPAVASVIWSFFNDDRTIAPLPS